MWNEAVQRSVDDNIFLTWEWLANWWKHFGRKRQFLLIALTDDRQIHAALPLMISTYQFFGLRMKVIEFIGTPLSDYQSFVVTDRKATHARMMIEYLRDRVRDWDLVELTHIPEKSETARILSDIPWGRAKLEKLRCASCPYISLPDKWEDYFHTLGPSFRKTLRRNERKLKQNYNVDFRICSDFQPVDDAMNTFIDLNQKRMESMRKVGIFSDSRVRDFHLDLARSFARRGWLTLDFVMLNGEAVAAGYNFKYANKILYYQSGFEPLYSKYSVGSIRHMYLIRHCIDNGMIEYDLLRGMEPYKSHWSTNTRRTFRFRTARKTLLDVISRWIGRNSRVSYFARAGIEKSWMLKIVRLADCY
jgi:CelD/BcsL family acetyltransferase involved in cellulose biosynthesis